MKYVKSWGGDGFDYRGFRVVNDKKSELFRIYDKNGFEIFQQANTKGSVGQVKHDIDRLIKLHGK